MLIRRDCNARLRDLVVTLLLKPQMTLESLGARYTWRPALIPTGTLKAP